MSNAETKPGIPAGEYWKWNQLLKWTAADTNGIHKIPTVALTETMINGHKYYFGVTELWIPQDTWGGVGLGAIRVRAANNSRGYDLVELFDQNNNWTAVNQTTGEFS